MLMLLTVKGCGFLSPHNVEIVSHDTTKRYQNEVHDHNNPAPLPCPFL